MQMSKLGSNWVPPAQQSESRLHRYNKRPVQVRTIDLNVVSEWYKLLEATMKAGAANQNYTRFQSFAERYIIERAGQFKLGNEKQDAWNAILDAKSIYGMIEGVDRAQQSQETTQDTTQARNISNQAAPMVGSIGGGPSTNDPKQLLAQAAQAYGGLGKIPHELVNNIFKLFGYGKTNTP